MHTSRPAWVDDRLFPFDSRFVELDGHVVHYVDEGDGPTILMLHGNPTWSFLYRDLIRSLRDDFRCVALDYPGFGLSHAAPGYRFLPGDHARVVARFVTALDLDRVVVMGQDWGGPIGLWTAAAHAERVDGLVLGNTWAWRLDGDTRFRVFSGVVGGYLGGVLIRQANAFVNVFIPAGHRRRRLRSAEMDHYRRPLDTPAAREASHVFPRELVASTAFMQDVERRLDRLEQVPTLFVWGDGDIAFGTRELERFERILPNHRTHVLKGAGHYIQEEAPEEIAGAIRAWWRQVATSGT
jgi:haloalkane dehalogenase